MVQWPKTPASKLWRPELDPWAYMVERPDFWTLSSNGGIHTREDTQNNAKKDFK